jgi:flagellar M-ring protein FliF
MGLLIALAALGTALMVYVLWAPSGGDYQVLYANLSQQDAGDIVAKLKEKSVPYELSGGGSAVLVPSDKVYELRLTLASEGLPRGGNVGFEIFNQQSLGTTEFVQKLNYQRALQGELVRTISQFPEVEDVRVHVVMPKESVFIDDYEPASAAVVLKMRPGRTLSRRQVEGMVHLVSAAVEGLKPENVKVVDMSGRILYAREEAGSTGALSSSQLEYQRSLEDGLKRKVEGMLEKVLGPGKAIARVSADVDFTQQSLTQEIFDPDSAVARTRQHSQETSSGQAGLALGIPGPDDDANQSGEGTSARDSKERFRRSQESISYEISKLAKQVVSSVGTLKRLSVAVIIDGVYKEAEGGEKTFVPRSKKELASFEAIVKRAVGFDEERGDQVEVTSIPFVLPEEAPAQSEGWLRLLGRVFSAANLWMLAKLAVALLLIFFVLRPAATGLARGGWGGAATLPAGSTRLELGMSEGKRLEARQEAMLLARSDPEKTAELLRGWLAKKE